MPANKQPPRRDCAGEALPPLRLGSCSLSPLGSFSCLLAPHHWTERTRKAAALPCLLLPSPTVTQQGPLLLLLLLSRSVVSDSVRPRRRQPTRLRCPWDSPGKNSGVGCHCLLQRMRVKSEREVAQSSPTLSNPMDCSLPGSSIHGSFQARVLEWGAIAFSSMVLYTQKTAIANETRKFILEGTAVSSKMPKGKVPFVSKTEIILCNSGF